MKIPSLFLCHLQNAVSPAYRTFSLLSYYARKKRVKMFLTPIPTRFISHIIQTSSKREHLSGFSAVFHTRAHFAALDKKHHFLQKTAGPPFCRPQPRRRRSLKSTGQNPSVPRIQSDKRCGPGGPPAFPRPGPHTEAPAWTPGSSGTWQSGHPPWRW